MAKKNNTVCKICGKEYYICLPCKDGKETPWRIHTDTAEHYKVYQILVGYNNGIYTQEEAANKLANVDISDINTYRDDIKKQIENIMNTENNSDIIEPVTEIKKVQSETIVSEKVKAGKGVGKRKKDKE